MIQIHTDGSCLGNPGAGGWAAVIVDGNNRREIFGGEIHTTNNRMELTAAIRALETVDAKNPIELFTDSSYLKNAFTNGWLVKWKRNGWRTATKSPVLNQDLWVELDDLIATRSVKFNWVKGHAGNFFNERCDELARNAARNAMRNAQCVMRNELVPTSLVPSPYLRNENQSSTRPVQLSLFD